MAFKDKFDKLISYFDTDEVSDVEETVEDDVQQPRVQPKVEVKPQPAQRDELSHNQFHLFVLNSLNLLQLVNVYSLNLDVLLMKISTLI